MSTSNSAAAVAVSAFIVGSALVILLLPALPMVSVPTACRADVDCMGYGSLSCVMFGVGGISWDWHYYLSAGAGCHLTESEAGISSVTTNTTVTSNLGDD